MRFTITKEDLERALAVCARCVSPKPPMPLLGGILLRGQEGRLSVTATDLELQISMQLPQVQLEEAEGECWLPAREIGDLVRLLGKDTRVEISQVQNHRILFRYPGGEVRLAGMNPEGFPLLEPAEPGKLEFAGAGTLEALRHVLYAASPDDLRPIFTGVEVGLTPGGSLSFAATDGHRLAVYRPSEEPNAETRVIPARHLKELLNLGKLLGEEPLKFSVGRLTASFYWGEVELHSRLIEGKFPDWRQALPKGAPMATLCASVSSLWSCLERARVIARASASGIPTVFLRKAGDQLVVEAQSETGEFQESLPVPAEGEDLTLAFNVDYLIEALRVLDREEEVNLGLYGSMSPMLITPKSASGYLALLLPLRVI
ncbi:DNA polymerase III subunit beta [Desulfothermobacter acidiphilus]|uniref:DNA polymerase III subunit beta n=1 Tax=Desulfothermobacter acidiphilus TaxID=1938353 RepID=UPI003F8AA062